MLTVSKLSKLQKAILTALKDSDEFWGNRVTYLAHEIAKRMEKRRDENIIYKERRKQLIYQKVMKGEMEADWGYFAMDRIQGDLLTPKFRATFSRSLKRLEQRGLINRIVYMGSEERNGESYWVQYSLFGNKRTCRVILTKTGREVAQSV